MSSRRDPPSRRGDRPTVPHSRIPDAVYYEVLPYLNGNEVKLWLALKSREWRKDGSRKGVIRKSLRRLAKDIAMAETCARRAFHGLRQKGLAEWAGPGIRLLEPAFTTAITTGFTTKGGSEHQAKLRRQRRRGAPNSADRCAASGAPTGVIPFPTNQLTHGRSDLTIRHPSAPSGALDAVESREAPESRAPSGARVRLKGSRAPSSRDGGGKEPSVETERVEKYRRCRCGAVLDEEDEERCWRCRRRSGELEVSPLGRDEAARLLGRLREEAASGTEMLRRPKEEQRRREAERKEELRRQARELQEGERASDDATE